MKHDRYKLQTEFHEHIVVHKTYTSDLVGKKRRVEVTIRWSRERVIGAGGFGTVWLQKEQGSGLGAVKTISKHQPGGQKIDFSRELETLAKLRELEVSAQRECLPLRAQ